MILLGQVSLTLEQATTGAHVLGVWTPGAVVSSTIVASVQPISGRERMALPEGYRARGRFKMYTAAVITTTDITNQKEQDVVLYKGDRFEVLAALDWTDHAVGTAHRKYFLALLDTDET